MKNPVQWANNIVEQSITDNIDKYLEAKQLGKEFWDEN